MFQALSSRTGSLVDAYAVSRDEEDVDTFSCPACFAPVILRRPRTEYGPSVHFAHLDATSCEGATLGPWGEAALALWEARLALHQSVTAVSRYMGAVGLPAIRAEGITPGRFEVFPERPRPSALHRLTNGDAVLTFPVYDVPGPGALTPKGLIVPCPDKLYRVLQGLTVAVTDGTRMVYGTADFVEAGWEPVGKPHSILGRAYAETGGIDRSRIMLTNPKWFSVADGLQPAELPPEIRPDDAPVDGDRPAMNVMEA